MKKIITAALLFLALTSIKAQTIIYVSSSATGTNNGTSWTNAYPKLYNALLVAPFNSQIWVKQGTYYPTSLNPQLEYNRGTTLQMKNGVSIYGGFAGTETILTQRDWKKNITILSGDIGIPNNKFDNASRIISNVNLDNTAILDGFTITGAYSINNYPIYPDGGGMYNDQSSPTLRNLIFSANEVFGYGGGMANGKVIGTAATCNPVMTNVIFENNKATNGGGIYNSNSNPTIKNAIFVNNFALQNGGAISNYNCGSIVYVNATIHGNTANVGGGISNDGNASGVSSPTFSNCIVWANSAPTNSQIYNGPTSDPSISNCNIQGGFSGPNNINADPKFVFPGTYKGLDGYYFTSDDGLTIKNTSPCLDAGESIFLAPEPTDIQGFQRNTVYDIGAYEARIITSQTSGNWENITTWLNSIIPTKNEYAIVNQGHTVTVNSTTQYPNTTADVAKEVTVKGTLKLNATSKVNLGY